MDEGAIRLDDLPVGGVRRLVGRDIDICLVRVADGAVFAVADRCSHEDASLSKGELLGFEIECPLHLSRFDVRTGEAVAPPAELSLATYPVRIVDGVIVVEVEGG